MLRDLTDDQRRLADCMSELSEEAYYAGWMEGLEYALWEAVLGVRSRYGRLDITSKQRERLMALSEQCGGWIVFDNEQEESWLPHEAWKVRFAAWRQRKPVQDDPSVRAAPVQIDAPYTRAEVLAAGDQLPDRGPLCHHCGLRIPQFADLASSDERRVRAAIHNGSPTVAAAELKAATGCSWRWAQLWVLHKGRPLPAPATSPCPFCSRPLRTSLAKQCRFCRRDWHDPADVVGLRSV